MPEKNPLIDITPENMKNIQVRRDVGYPHSSDMHFAFMTVQEVDHAAANFPLVFIRGEGEKGYALVALLGLKNGENLFYDAAAKNSTRWKGTYVPASIARYPFFMRPPEGELGPDNPPVFCIQNDERYVSEEMGQALYNEDGSETPFLNGMRTALQVFSRGIADTAQFIQILEKHNLITEVSIEFKFATGAQHNLAGLYTIDRKAFMALSDEAVVELHKSGVLSRINVIGASLAQVNRLVQLTNFASTDDQITGVTMRDPNAPAAPANDAVVVE